MVAARLDRAKLVYLQRKGCKEGGKKVVPV